MDVVSNEWSECHNLDDSFNFEVANPKENNMLTKPFVPRVQPMLVLSRLVLMQSN
jgi:hypothetical protein